MTHQRTPDPLLVLQARISARARLWKANEYDSLADMMGPLYAHAKRSKLFERFGDELMIEAIDAMMMAELGAKE